MGPRTELVLALVAAVLIMGQFASLVEGNELADCTLTDVGGVQTLVVGSDITVIPQDFCKDICKEGGGMKKIDFSGATSLVEIARYAFGGDGGTPCTSTLEGKLDLTYLPKLRLIGWKAFANSEQITSVDISNCPNLGDVQPAAFKFSSMTSFVAKNVGTTSDQTATGAGCSDLICSNCQNCKTGSSARYSIDGYQNGPSSMSGALMIGTNNFPGTLELLDFRGTAVGRGYLNYAKWSYPGDDRNWFFSSLPFSQTPNYQLFARENLNPGNNEVSFSAQRAALFSYKRCEVVNAALTCCTEVNGNNFKFLQTYINFRNWYTTDIAEQGMYVGSCVNVNKTDVGDQEKCTGQTEIPSDTCPSCAANCDSCDSIGAPKCDTCSFGYSLTSDKTCEDTNECAGNTTCEAGTTCADVEAPGTGYKCKAKCSDLDLNHCKQEQVLSDTLFCQDAICKKDDDAATCCVARANCSTITCAAGTENKTSAPSELCDGATCDSATADTADNKLCCQDTDGCIDYSPDCGTNATCADVEAPGTGHKCRCDDGFTGTTTTDNTAATCTPVQLGGAALPSTSSAAVWIVSSIFASVFAVSSSGA